MVHKSLSDLQTYVELLAQKRLNENLTYRLAKLSDFFSVTELDFEMPCVLAFTFSRDDDSIAIIEGKEIIEDRFERGERVWDDAVVDFDQALDRKPSVFVKLQENRSEIDLLAA
jgi:hypothetical protein